VFLDHGAHSPIQNEDLLLNDIFEFLFQNKMILVRKYFFYKVILLS